MDWFRGDRLEEKLAYRPMLHRSPDCDRYVEVAIRVLILPLLLDMEVSLTLAWLNSGIVKRPNEREERK